MGMYSNIDIDLQELVATIETLRADGYNLGEMDSDAGLDARGVLLSRLTALGWLTPTEREVAQTAFNAGDGKRLLSLISGPPITVNPADIYQRIMHTAEKRGIHYREAKVIVDAELLQERGASA